jgi:hypothetical protein
MGFAFAKSERPQRAERFFETRCYVHIDHGAIGRTIRVPENEPCRDATLDEKLPAVLCAMMRST